MILECDYAGQSGIANSLGGAQLAFATNTLRESTFLQAELRFPLQLREGLAALYSVVVSDFRYRPRDRFAFFAWLEEQDRKFLARLAIAGAKAREQMERIEARLSELDQARLLRLRPFHDARRRYFDHVYQNQVELNLLLDPVISVHPDEVSFEAFSRDESSYARLSVRHDCFTRVESLECGTTNIDFSARLHGELERMRSYRQTRFEITPGGFGVALAGGGHKEKKIKLPDSWLLGFLQVQSVMAMGLHHLQLAPIDLYNLCRALRRRRARRSPRALRFELVPGERSRVVLEPWEQTITLGEISRYAGPRPITIRTWGRDRLQTLARMIPTCDRVDVFLCGDGLPSIYILDLGMLSFTLGLSGWTDADWTGSDRFSLLSRPMSVNADELARVYQGMQGRRLATDVEAAEASGLGLEKVRGALSYLCQVGRAMFDLRAGVYRHRDLFLEPFSAKQAVAQARALEEQKNPQGKAAKQIFERGDVRIIARRPVQTGYKLSGSSKGSDGRRVRPLVHVDHEGLIIEATCTCPYHQKNQLKQGPCEHILSLRLAHMARLELEGKGGN